MIKEIIKEYKNGEIDTKEYGKKMFEAYESLLEYCDLLKSSMVEKLEIDKDNVIVKIKTKDNSIKMLLYPVDSAAVPATALSLGSYEQEEMDMSLALLNMLDDESVIFDVGANLGWYTLNILKDVSSRKVYSFEPIEETYYKLKKNIEINKVENANAFNIGFYKENKTMDFFYDIIASGASSLADLRKLETTKKVLCELRRMDDFIKEHDINRLDFIKCDVEGSELFVYEGASDSINRFKPIVFSEMLRKWSAKFEYHPNDIIKLFKNWGYQCFIMDNGKLKNIYLVDENTIETNYFFLHTEKHRSIIAEFVK